MSLKTTNGAQGAGSSALIVLRWLYGSFFLLTGVWILISVSTGIVDSPVQPTPEAAAFTRALSKSRFMDPLLAWSFVVGGTSLLFERSVPLGLVTLAPSVAVIFLFHLLLSGQIVVGIMVASVFGIVAWFYRRRLSCLWREWPHR